MYIADDTKENKLPLRKHPRLKDYDYSQAGCYFVTFCTKDRKNLLSRICVGRDHVIPPQIQLTPAGIVVEKYICGMERVYRDVTVDHYVVMPNHVHLLLTLGGGVRSPRPTDLTTVIRSLKTMVTRELGKPIWQDSFYDHVVRNREDYLRIWEYVDNNPAHWAEDTYYRDENT